jgi:hypothetical protein
VGVREDQAPCKFKRKISRYKEATVYTNKGI